MIRKDKKTFKDGTVKTFLRVVESYRPGKGKNPKQRTLRNAPVRSHLRGRLEPLARSWRATRRAA